MTETSLSIETITDIHSLERIREEWDLLLQENATQTAELTFDWQVTYWKHFNQNSELFIVIVRDNDSIVAIAPLKISCLRNMSIRLRCLEFIAASESNYQDFIIAQDNEPALELILQYLDSHESLWDIIRLDHIPETSILARKLRSNPKKKLMLLRKETCLYLDIESAWEDFASRTKSSRENIKRRVKRLARYGRLRDFHCSNEEEFERNLRHFFRLHRDRWNRTNTPSQFNDERYSQFYLEVTSKLAARKHVDLFVLLVEDVPVALLYSLVFHDNYVLQIISYNAEYAKGSPPIVIIELFIREAFRGRVKRIDLGSYADYKRYWSENEKCRYNCEIFPRGPISFGFYAILKGRYFFRDRVDREDLLGRFLRFVRRTMRQRGRDARGD